MIRHTLHSLHLSLWLGVLAQAQTISSFEATQARIDEYVLSYNTLPEMMAQNLGLLHGLRTLCYGQQDQKWRQHAQTMIRLEATNNKTLQKALTLAFNAGFKQARKDYKVCDIHASTSASMLAENGSRMAIMLARPQR